MYTAYISLSRCRICIYCFSFSESLFFPLTFFWWYFLKHKVLPFGEVHCLFFKILLFLFSWGSHLRDQGTIWDHKTFTPMFSSKEFLVLALKFGILIQFWMFLHMEWCRDPILSFYMLFQHCFIEETITSPWIICWHPFQRWIDCQCEDVFLDSRLTQLISMFVLMPTHTVLITVTWK